MTEINKDKFFQPNFCSMKYLDEFLSNDKQIEELDILAFKLKILHKDLDTNIQSNINNIIKDYTKLESDLSLYNSNIDNLHKRYTNLKKNRNLINLLSKLNKVVLAIKFINNLKKLIDSRK
jgi:hypothetical protein